MGRPNQLGAVAALLPATGAQVQADPPAGHHVQATAAAAPPGGRLKERVHDSSMLRRYAVTYKISIFGRKIILFMLDPIYIDDNSKTPMLLEFLVLPLFFGYSKFGDGYSRAGNPLSNHR